MIEIDLHEMTVSEALEYFIETYNSNKGQSLRIIHGYGSTGVGGKIRSAVRKFINTNSSSFSRIEFGEVVERNQGYTVVYYRSQLPGVNDILRDKILAFCSVTPKTKEKIIGNFRNYGSGFVLQVIKETVASGKLTEIKGKVGKYKA